eukprot:173810_1
MWKRSQCYRIFQSNMHMWKRTQCYSTHVQTQTQGKIPVTVLSGFLGGGKTTLLNHALHNASGLKIATIVNDMSSINIDSSMIEQGAFNHVEEELVPLTNGCICCTSRQDLIKTIDKLTKMNKFDYILIESTGISEPLPVAQTFTVDESLQNSVQLDTLLTVVDANNFLNFIHAPMDLQALKMGATESDQRPLSKLIMDQIEFANIILLNKCDLVDTDKLSKIKQILSMLNPSAKIIQTEYCDVDMEHIFNTNLYEKNLNEFVNNPAWKDELRIGSNHQSEAIKYGIESFSFVNHDRPFHPERLYDLFSNQGNIFEGVLRAKGYFWVANDMDSRFDFHIAGPIFSIVVNTLWLEPAMRNLLKPSFVRQYLSQNEDGDVESIKAHRRQILNDMTQRYKIVMKDGVNRRFGDRRNEMVFIGETDQMQKQIILEGFEQSLLNDDELNKGWKYWNEAFQHTFKNVPRCIVI